MKLKKKSIIIKKTELIGLTHKIHDLDHETKITS